MEPTKIRRELKIYQIFLISFVNLMAAYCFNTDITVYIQNHIQNKYQERTVLRWETEGSYREKKWV